MTMGIVTKELARRTRQHNDGTAYRPIAFNRILAVVHASPLTFANPLNSLSFSSNELQVQRNPNGDEEEGSSTG